MKRIGKQLLSFLLSFLLLTVAVFYISRLTPTDPLVSYYGERAEKMSVAEKEQARERLGLNAPIHVQYFRWVSCALQGDFGISYQYKQPVTAVVSQRIGNTCLLVGVGFVLVFVLSLVLGLVCAWLEDTFLDRCICKAGTLVSCIPEFWLSLVLILVFSVSLGWLPSSGAYSVGKQADTLDRIVHLILPVTVVVMSHLWYYAYLLRNKLLEEIRSEYVQLCKAKGLGKRRILFRHCLPNAMPAFLGIMALALPHILGGTYVVEMVFGYPGLGTLSYESARYADYNLLMVLCVLTGAVVMALNSLGGTVSGWVDPRLRAKGEVSDL